MLWSQFRLCSLEQQLRQEWFEPKRPLIFISVDYFQHVAFRDDRLAGRPKRPLRPPTIGAFKSLSDRPCKGQARPGAIGRLDRLHVLAAGLADKTFGCTGSCATAELAHFRVDQGQ